jgi:hypothetical protein
MTSRESDRAEGFRLGAPIVAALAALALAAVVLMPFLRGRLTLADDAYSLYMPSYRLQARILREGMWPLWNSNVGFGQPWALSGNSTHFYVPQVLWGQLVGWSERSYLAYLLAHFALGGWLTGCFARRTGLSPAAGVFLALTFVGNGWILGTVSNPVLLVPAMWFPLAAEGLLTLHEARTSSVWARGVRPLAIALVAIETSAYPLMKLVFYAALVAGYWALGRERGSLVRGVNWRGLAWAGFIAALATAPEWATAVSALHLADRYAAEFTQDALFHNVANFLQFATALLPGQFLARAPQLGTLWLERSWWMGVLTLFLLLVAVSRPSARTKRVAAALAIPALLFFLFALGGHAFFRETAGALVPVLRHFRHSHLARVPVMFALFYVAASVFSELLSRPEAFRAAPRRWLVALAWATFLALCTAAALREKDTGALAEAVYSSSASVGWKAEGLHHLFFALLAFTAFEHRASLGPRRLATALVLVHFVGLADVGYRYHRLIGASRDPYPRKEAEPFRAASPQPNVRVIGAPLSGQWFYAWDGNTKVLRAYNPPEDHRTASMASDPAFAEAARTLVSCEGTRCADVTFEIERYFGNSIVVRGRGPAARIVVHDFFEPGWSATLDGVSRPVELERERFKAVEVPERIDGDAREWVLRLDYRPPWFLLYLALAVAGVGLFVFAPDPRTLLRRRYGP